MRGARQQAAVLTSETNIFRFAQRLRRGLLRSAQEDCSFLRSETSLPSRLRVPDRHKAGLYESAIRSAAILAELSTPGSPAPGWVPAPTK